MFGWYKAEYKKLSDAQRQKLSDECRYICQNIYNPNLELSIVSSSCLVNSENTGPKSALIFL